MFSLSPRTAAVVREDFPGDDLVFLAGDAAMSGREVVDARGESENTSMVRFDPDLTVLRVAVEVADCAEDGIAPEGCKDAASG